MAANSSGEEKSSAPSRGVTPARIAVIAALAVAVIALAVVLFSGGGGHKYTLIFQNAGQLVPDNQVLIGGSPAGSVESIELSHSNLAEVHVEVSQELHQGTTATIRATSLSGVANHYVSISPGPNSNPALEEGAELGLGSTTTPVDIDQFFNTFPPSVRKGLSNFIKGNAAIYAGQGPDRQQRLQVLRPGAQPHRRLRQGTERRPGPVRPLRRQLQPASRPPSPSAAKSSPARSPTPTPPSARSPPRTSPSTRRLRRLPPAMRQANTTFVNLRAALDDLDPLVETAKPATKNLAPFLAELRPVIPKFVPVTRNLRLTVARPGKANDAAELLAVLPTVQQRASKAFPHSEDAIAAFQPNLNFARAYTPDLFNGLGKIGQVAGYYDGNGHYVRAATAVQNLFKYNAGMLEPITKAEQFDAFGSSAPVHRRCPGGATQRGAGRLQPLRRPALTSGSVSSSECNPADAPPGP